MNVGILLQVKIVIVTVPYRLSQKNQRIKIVTLKYRALFINCLCRKSDECQPVLSHLVIVHHPVSINPLDLECVRSLAIESSPPFRVCLEGIPSPLFPLVEPVMIGE